MFGIVNRLEIRFYLSYLISKSKLRKSKLQMQDKVEMRWENMIISYEVTAINEIPKKHFYF